MADPGLSSRVYRAAPVWAQNLLISLYGMRLQRLRYGGVHATTLGELLESQWAPQAQWRARQLEALNRVLEHARRTVPFYRGASWPLEHVSDVAMLAELPITSKPELQQAGREMVSQSYADRRLLEVHTGGTTGTPLTIYCDAGTLQRNYAFFSRLRHWASIADGSRVATFAGRVLQAPVAGAPHWRRNWAANTLLFSSYHIAPDTLPAYAAALAAWAPQLIDAYPSSLEPVARYLIEHDALLVRPTAVITSSETLLPDVRRLIEQAFSCRVFDYYGSAEMAAFVSQCPAGSYHVNPEFGVVELVKDGHSVAPGEPGEIVATSLINPVMPLIRYSMGDWAVWEERPCTCGRALPCLREIGGRVDDVVLTPEGRLVGRLDPVFKVLSSVHECRIVQDAPDHLRVEVVTRGPVPAEEERLLIAGLGERVGPSMRIDIVPVGALERTRSGKLRTVVREWRP